MTGGSPVWWVNINGYESGQQGIVSNGPGVNNSGPASNPGAAMIVYSTSESIGGGLAGPIIRIGS